jgi:hypothetical protein
MNWLLLFAGPGVFILFLFGPFYIGFEALPTDWLFEWYGIPTFMALAFSWMFGMTAGIAITGVALDNLGWI